MPCSFADPVVTGACYHVCHLEGSLRIDRATDIELVEVVGGTASVADVFDLFLAGVRSEACGADILGRSGRHDFAKGHGTLVS